jgi:hypothetical protein
MTFEDLNKYADRGYYLVPNEGTLDWRKLVKGLHVNRAAAICSSGEVGLIALLPTVRKELVLVDHSYASLSVAMLKYTMLRELGARETRRLLTESDSHKELSKNITKFLKKLPKEVQEAYRGVVMKRGGSEGPFVIQPSPRVDYNRIDPKTGWYAELPSVEPPKVSSMLTREWDRLPQRDILRCTYKLDKVKFLHGDLSDLVERGPFDLLYISNATTHRGRNGAPDLRELSACLKPGGYVLVAHHADPTVSQDQSLRQRPYAISDSVVRAAQDAKWSVVGTARSTGGSMSWQQTLYQLPVTQEVAA